MRLFRFHWRDDKHEDSTGATAAEALQRLGYGRGAVQALDWYEELPGPPASNLQPRSEGPAMNQQDYHAAVVAEMVRQTGWPEPEARNMVGAPDDLKDSLGDGLTPCDAAHEILVAAAS